MMNSETRETLKRLGVTETGFETALARWSAETADEAALWRRWEQLEELHADDEPDYPDLDLTDIPDLPDPYDD